MKYYHLHWRFLSILDGSQICCFDKALGYDCFVPKLLKGNFSHVTFLYKTDQIETLIDC